MAPVLVAAFLWYYEAGAVALTAVWDDADNGDAVLSNGDTLTITFDTATDRPGGTGVQNKTRVDSMFSFENSLGANYTGQWISTTQFRVTIVDATGGTAQIGDDVSRQSNSFRIFQLDTTGGTAFSAPQGVATNSTDFIFASDAGVNNVQIFNQDGTFSGETLTGGVAFNDPRDVATNSTDFIFVVDSANDNVQIFNPDGTYSGVNLDTTGGTGFASTRDVATNSTNFIFVADRIGNVQIFNPDGTFADSLDTTGGTAFSGGGFGPSGVAANSTGFIFVSDPFNANIQIFRPDGTFAAAQPTTGGQTFLNPEFLAVDGDDRLMVPDNGRDIVQVFGPASIQNTAETSLVFTNTITTSGDFGAAVPNLATVVADDPDNADEVLSSGDTLVFTFSNPTNATAGGTMTLAEINGNFTFGTGESIGTAASGLWDTNSQLTITINADDGDVDIGDAVGVAGGANIADSATETEIFTSSATITGDFGALPVSSGGGGGGGDSTPPSFTTGFSEGEPVLKINGDSFATNDLDGGTQGTITAQQGDDVSFTVALYDDGGAGNIRHVDLFLNRQGATILNELAETYITYDEGRTTIHDPSGIVQSAQITKTQQGSKAVFAFDIVFSAAMETSDLLVRAWDLERNVMYLHANDIISVMPSQPIAEPTQAAPEQMQEQAADTQTAEPQAAQDTIQDQTIRQWAGYDAESATDAQLVGAVVGDEITDDQTVQVPSWVKGDVAEWYVSGKITYDEFAAVINYLYDYGLLISEESEDET